ncbi:MAG: hypothetical protein AAFX03_08975 [Pseudomonadota bacterium]
MASSIAAVFATIGLLILLSRAAPTPPAPTLAAPVDLGESWHALLPRPGVQRANGALIGRDGGVTVVGGAYDPNGEGFTDALFLRFNGDGDLINERAVDGFGENEFFAVAPAPDGDVYTAGRHDYKMSVSRVDEAGFVVWRSLIEGDTPNAAAAVAPAPGGVYAVGDTGLNGDLLIARLAVDGREVWRQRIGAEDIGETALGAASTPSGALYVAMQRASEQAPPAFEIMKVDRTGAVEWTMSPDLGGAGRINALAMASDGDILAAGALGGDGLVIRLSPRGQEEWRRVYNPGEDDEIMAIAAVAGGGFFVAGQAGDADTGFSNAWAMRADAAGEPIWNSLFSSGVRDGLFAAAASPEGALAFAGRSLDDGSDGGDVRVGRIAPQNAEGPATEARLIPQPGAPVSPAPIEPIEAIIADVPAEPEPEPPAAPAPALQPQPASANAARPPAFNCTLFCQSRDQYATPYPLNQEIDLRSGGVSAAEDAALAIAERACRLSGGEERQPRQRPSCAPAR